MRKFKKISQNLVSFAKGETNVVQKTERNNKYEFMY